MAGKSLLAPSLAKIQLSDNLKVPLAPGKSLVDWIRHSGTAKNLSGTNGKYLKVDEVELQKHTCETDAWMVLRGLVYNVTPYLSYHPGGVEEIMMGVGKDSTDLFNEVHCWVNYEAMLKPCLVGQYVGSLAILEKAKRKKTENASTSPSTSTAIKDSVFNQAIVRKIERLTHDVYLISLTVPTTYPPVPIGHHVFLTASINDSKVIRPYTPVYSCLYPDSLESDVQIHLMIKLYQNGSMSSHLKTLKEGDSISLSGPEGNFLLGTIANVETLTLLAAGTGFTPMAKLIAYQLRKNRKLKLILFNKTLADIPWKDQMDNLVELNDNFTVVHVLSEPTSDWTGPTGRIKEEILVDQVVSPSNSAFLCICGPLEFTNTAAQLAKNLGWNDRDVHLFKL